MSQLATALGRSFGIQGGGVGDTNLIPALLGRPQTSDATTSMAKPDFEMVIILLRVASHTCVTSVRVAKGCPCATPGSSRDVCVRPRKMGVCGESLSRSLGNLPVSPISPVLAQLEASAAGLQRSDPIQLLPAHPAPPRSCQKKPRKWGRAKAAC